MRLYWVQVPRAGGRCGRTSARAISRSILSTGSVAAACETRLLGFVRMARRGWTGRLAVGSAGVGEFELKLGNAQRRLRGGLLVECTNSLVLNSCQTAMCDRA